MLSRFFIGVILLTLFIPLFYLLQNILDITSFWQSFDANLVKLTWNSVSCAILTSLFALLIATPTAFFFSRYDFLFKKLFFIIFCLPLIIPSYILAYSYQEIAKPYFEVTGFWGTVFILTIANYPLAFLFICNSLRHYDCQLDESSYVLGYNRWQTFFKVTFFQILPAILSSSVLICLYSLSDFGTPTLMNFPTFTREIKILYDLAQLDQANHLTTFLIIIAFIFIFINEKFNRRQQTFSNNVTKENLYQVHSLRGRKLALFSAIMTFICLILILPLNQIFLWFYQGVASETSSFLSFKEETFNSLLISFLTALLTLTLCFSCSYFYFRNKKSKLNKFINFANFLGNATPGIALAFCIIFLFANTPLYQTLFIMTLALSLRFFAQAYNPLKEALEKIHPHHYEAAQILGKNSLQIFWQVIFPQIKTTLAMTFGIIFIFVFKELAVTLLLAPAGFNTLPQEIWNFMDDGEFSQIGIPIFTVIFISSFLLIKIYYLQKFRKKKP